MPAPLSIGDPAPDFDLSVVGGDYAVGSRVRLSGLKGTRVVLYFYPKDATPGCTVQACALRDEWEEFGGKAKVFGVSIDPVSRHEKFIRKHELPFPLLSDEGAVVAQAYGVWVEKSMYGKTFLGTERTTFVIDEGGRIEAVLRKVKPAGHLAALREALG